jgi:hypothetical protein
MSPSSFPNAGGIRGPKRACSRRIRLGIGESSHESGKRVSSERNPKAPKSFTWLVEECGAPVFVNIQSLQMIYDVSGLPAMAAIICIIQVAARTQSPTSARFQHD